jgi:hypothetical protein
MVLLAFILRRIFLEQKLGKFIVLTGSDNGRVEVILPKSNWDNQDGSIITSNTSTILLSKWH